MSDDRLDMEINVKEVSYVLGLTEPTVRGLIKANALKPFSAKPYRFKLVDMVRQYVGYLKSSSRNAESDSGASLDQRKAQADVDYREAKAKMMQISLAELDGKMCDARDVEAVNTELILSVRSNLLALPGQCAMELSELHTPEECSAFLKGEVSRILSELTDHTYNPDVYKTFMKRRKGLEEILEADDDRE